ncbi:hypothetical protein BAE44_0003651 [Dichanthelium oligosanthes]|uniref:EF-hand domain-containing protein n=1 Tax=Dichanthelium oligosanthes TaxID=888268 RepID=A0A1E5WDM7_9POAL|nr:hypothetical protein BAE44_0003651 [Dichanthelium oligosanthes]
MGGELILACSPSSAHPNCHHCSRSPTRIGSTTSACIARAWPSAWSPAAVAVCAEPRRRTPPTRAAPRFSAGVATGAPSSVPSVPRLSRRLLRDSKLSASILAQATERDAAGNHERGVLNGSTVRAFVADEAAFAQGVDARFAVLDTNDDGVLSRAELRRALESVRLLDGAGGFRSAEPAPLPAEVTALYDAVLSSSMPTTAEPTTVPSSATRCAASCLPSSRARGRS